MNIGYRLTSKSYGKALFLVVAMTVSYTGSISAAEKKHPVPSADECAAVIKRVQDVLKNEYADRSTEGRQALASRLMKMGGESSEKIADKYALLQESWSISTKIGDAESAQATAKEIIENFDVDALGLLLKTQLDSAKAIRRMEPAVAADFARALVSLAREALKSGRPLVVEQAVRAAQTYARKAKDKGLKNEFRELKKQAIELKRAVKEWEEAIIKLKKSPDDPAANLQAGYYVCFWQGNFEAGLPFLAKGEDDSLSAAARTDLRAPTLAEARLLLADAWWKVTEKQTGLPGIRAAARAGKWYQAALPALKGLDKALAESRIQEIAKMLESASEGALSGGGSWPGNRQGLIFLWTRGSQSGKKGKYSSTLRGEAKVQKDSALVLAKGALVVDGISKVLRKACQKKSLLTIEIVLQADNLSQVGPARIVSFSRDSGNRNFTLGQQGNQLVLRLRTPQTGQNGSKPQSDLCQLTAGKRSHVLVSYRPGELTCYHDGKEAISSEKVSGDFSNWEDMTMILGDEASGGRDWSGTIYGLAIYSRFIDKEEARANHRNAAQLFNVLK